MIKGFASLRWDNFVLRLPPASETPLLLLILSLSSGEVPSSPNNEIKPSASYGHNRLNVKSKTRM